MLKLHLGVIDVPYVNAPTKRQKKATSSTVTTGDVAGFLEDKYEVMGHFVEMRGDDIAKALENSIDGHMETLLMKNEPLNHNMFGTAESEIKLAFDDFILTGQMDGVVNGVPTQAAKDRALGKAKSSRKVRAKPSNANPVSFYDSGLYLTNFIAWVK